jgi:hypothetical protein
LSRTLSLPLCTCNPVRTSNLCNCRFTRRSVHRLSACIEGSSFARQRQAPHAGAAGFSRMGAGLGQAGTRHTYIFLLSPLPPLPARGRLGLGSGNNPLMRLPHVCIYQRYFFRPGGHTVMLRHRRGSCEVLRLDTGPPRCALAPCRIDVVSFRSLAVVCRLVPPCIRRTRDLITARHPSHILSAPDAASLRGC